MMRLALAALPLLIAAPAAAQTMSPRAVVEAEFRALNAHDSSALAALYAPDAVVTQSDSCAPTKGAEAIRAGEQALFAAMPDLSAEVTDWVVEGDQVAVLFTGRSSHIPGGQMQLADFFTVKDGKIVRDVTIFNAGGACK